MPKKVSYDAKLSAVNTYNNKHTLNLYTNQICGIFSICRQTIYNWNKNYKLNQLHRKIINPKKSSTITDEIEKFIISKTVNNPKFSVKKIIKKIKNKFQISINKRTIYLI